jgi:endonuclease/exonuclease/phosphatase family metal-dependent hydrolase
VAHLARKRGGKPDGCATFVRCAGGLEVESAVRHTYEDGSGHVALLVTLALGDQRLLVANTHFKWDDEDKPAEERWPVLQAASLARVLGAGPGPAAVCGDLNVRPGDAALLRLEAAGLRDAFDPPDEPHTCCFGGRTSKIDHVLVRGFAATGRTSPSARGLVALPTEEEPSDHLPLGVELRWP